jgi:hypothetical protein
MADDPDLDENDLSELWNDYEGYYIWIRPEDESEIVEADLTGKEREEAIDEWIWKVRSGDVDHDAVPTYAISKHRDCWVLIGRTGYSFSGIDTWLVGSFSSKDKAIDYMSKDGRVEAF